MVDFSIFTIYIGATLTLMASGGTVKATLNSVMYANLGIQIAM